MRQRIAMEAARLMAEHGIKDYYTAKKKAAAQLGAPDTQNMPRNDEIELALSNYQRLFQAETQPQHLKQLREEAVQAMRFLQRFDPRLVGSVLSGTAHAHSEINLHVFTDAQEDLALFLMQEDIPFEASERYLRLDAGAEGVSCPVYRFMAGDTVVDLTVFPEKGIRQAPRSPLDGKPMQRVTLPVLAKLLKSNV
jgi:hypothetical protein